MAADPTYPLYPVACILSVAMLFLVLLTSFIRQSWNLGVVFLSVSLLLENLSNAVNTVVWADNADVKFYVYCDIVSRLQVFTFIVKPMATLIITRRLYLITSLQSVELPNKAAVRRGILSNECQHFQRADTELMLQRLRNIAVEWVLGFGIPALVAGPLYYIVQYWRFQVLEGFGCENAADQSILSILLINTWTVVPPLVSIVFYYPRVAWIFYHQRRDMDHFLHTNASVSRINYFRVLALASIDIIMTLPISIASIVLTVADQLSQQSLPFYFGWTFDHTEWDPQFVTYAEIVAGGTADIAQQYFVEWTSPILAFAIFALFGVTAEARVSYWRAICTIGDLFGWKPTARSSVETKNPPERAQDMELDIKLGSRTPSFIRLGARSAKQGTDNELDEHVDREAVSASQTNIAEKDFDTSDDIPTIESCLRESRTCYSSAF